MAEMQKIRLCYCVCKDTPALLSMDAAALPAPAPAQLTAKAPNVATKGLSHYLLKPPGMKGKELLAHMLKFARRRVQRDSIEERSRCRCASSVRISEWLDVAITPEQQMLLNPTREDLTIREILKDCGGEGATKKLAKRKLDAVGFINSDCCEATSDTRKDRLKKAAQLAASLAEIHNLQAAEAAEAKKVLEIDLRSKVPDAIMKLISHIQKTGVIHMAFDKLTVAEIQALCVICFVKEKPNGLKSKVVTTIEGYHREHPHVMVEALKAHCSAAGL